MGAITVSVMSCVISSIFALTSVLRNGVIMLSFNLEENGSSFNLPHVVVLPGGGGCSCRLDQPAFLRCI